MPNILRGIISEARCRREQSNESALLTIVLSPQVHHAIIEELTPQGFITACPNHLVEMSPTLLIIKKLMGLNVFIMDQKEAFRVVIR